MEGGSISPPTPPLFIHISSSSTLSSGAIYYQYPPIAPIRHSFISLQLFLPSSPHFTRWLSVITSPAPPKSSLPYLSNAPCSTRVAVPLNPSFFPFSFVFGGGSLIGTKGKSNSVQCFVFRPKTLDELIRNPPAGMHFVHMHKCSHSELVQMGARANVPAEEAVQYLTFLLAHASPINPKTSFSC